MYALKLPSVKSTVRQAEPVRGRARHVRDEFDLPPAIDPSIGLIDEPAPAAIEEPVVQAVTPVDPQVKKYRATITRTVTQSAIVEYEALETQGQYSVAEDLAAQVPAESWTTDAENSWCYIDKLEDLGPAAAATSEIETADDDTLETDPAADEDDEQDAPLTAGRSRRRQRRAMPDEIITQAQEILDQASAAASALGTEGSDPQAIVDTLSQLLEQVQDLQANAEGDTSGSDADIDAQVSAVQFLNDVAQQISQMMEEAQADVFAAEDEAAAAAA